MIRNLYHERYSSIDRHVIGIEYKTRITLSIASHGKFKINKKA